MGRYEKIKIRWSNYWKNSYATVRSGQDICRVLECMCGGNRKMFAEQISTKIQIKKVMQEFLLCWSNIMKRCWTRKNIRRTICWLY